MKSCAGCHKETESTLKCPTCLRLSLPSSYFCSQDCFKTNWKSHARIHTTENISSVVASLPFTVGSDSLKKGFDLNNKATWTGDLNLRAFLDFNFTGPLRPWPRTLPVEKWPNSIAVPDYAKHGRSREEEKDRNKPIQVYDAEAITIIRRVCGLGRRALDLAHSLCKVGITTETIDDAVRNFCFENSAYPSPLNYYHFPKSCCTSVNEVICHGIPDLRPLEDGDIVNVDISIYSEGYHCDLNETFLVGDKRDPETVKLVKASHDSLQEAIKICKPGVPYSQIGNVIQKYIDSEGFSVVRRYTGHGVGRLFHTNPYVPHYKNNKAKGIMQPGHVFTIEPMINQGTQHDTLWPDEWTAVTKDGLKSAQFEHQILITETGCEVLTARTTESPPLEFDENNEL